MAPKKQQYLSSPAPKQDDPQDKGGTVFGETSEYNGTEDVEDVKSVGKQPKMLVRHLSAKNETNETREQEVDSRTQSRKTVSISADPLADGNIKSMDQMEPLSQDGAGRVGGKMISVGQIERMRSMENGSRVTDNNEIGDHGDLGVL